MMCGGFLGAWRGVCDTSRMSPEAWITLAVIGASILVLILPPLVSRGSGPGPDLVMGAALTVLLAAGVIEPTAAFQGFANPALVTIAALLVVAAGVQETGALDLVARRVLGQPKGLAGAQLRVMLPVGALSSFLNNTPVVAMFVPLLQGWARRNGLSVSKLMLPLSYAAILGGTCTLIGTSTNLVVAGMARGVDPDLRLGMFDVTWLGGPALVLGTIYVLLASRWLLADRKGVDTSEEAQRAYLIRMRVDDASPVAGQTIEASGLRRLPGLFLAGIERDGELTPAPPPVTRLRAGDILRFTGAVETAVDLRKLRLTPEAEQSLKLDGKRRWVEVVVAAQSPLVGRSVRAIGFRTKYNAAIIAVHRAGAHVEGRIGDIELQPADVLLLETHPTFVRKHRNDLAFALVTDVDGSTPPKHEKSGVAFVVLLAMVVANVAGLLPLVTASLIAAGAMLVFRCLDGNQARQALDVKVLITIGSALGIGHAMEASGAAEAAATHAIGLVQPYGTTVLLVTIYALTAVVSGAVYTATGAALMFPIAAQVATSMGIPLHAMTLLVMIAASTAFSTPHGYAANLLVKTPGGYTPADFLRFGLPLQVIIAASSITVLHLVFL